MFFKDRIKSIKESDSVLEIGPGASPYYRSDVFLELQFETDQERIAQSGQLGILETDKRIVYYDGGDFPFKDEEFDYVICSHVLEHVDDADKFLKEIQRVGKKGYLEYPTIYYDYLYNIAEHKLFLYERNGVINWMTKAESELLNYDFIQAFFYRTSQLGYKSLTKSFKGSFFQGFEWFDSIESKRVSDLKEVCYSKEEIASISNKMEYESFNNPIFYNKISLKEFLTYRLKKIFK